MKGDLPCLARPRHQKYNRQGNSAEPICSYVQMQCGAKWAEDEHASSEYNRERRDFVGRSTDTVRDSSDNSDTFFCVHYPERTELSIITLYPPHNCIGSHIATCQLELRRSAAILSWPSGCRLASKQLNSEKLNRANWSDRTINRLAWTRVHQPAFQRRAVWTAKSEFEKALGE